MTRHLIIVPWRLLSGMGNWSYAVLTQWRGPDEDGKYVVIPGSAPPKVFKRMADAKAHAQAEVAAWPYRAEWSVEHDSARA